ncbi:hypothetical protein ABZ614_20670 [Streptomyces sp. NPDC013178]|uniref:hypothetical protein n=1 Tax=Streptomyces sp. NPDC013178 TaxID=3155118 RepID=UPI0033C2BF95
MSSYPLPTRDAVLGEDLLRNPHRIGPLLAAQAPPYRVRTADGTTCWFVTRPAECRAALGHPQLVRDAGQVARMLGLPGRVAGPPHASPAMRLLDGHRLHTGPERQPQLRALLAQALGSDTTFTTWLTELAGSVWRGAKERHEAGTDVLSAFVEPFSVAVIGDLLGLPPADCRALIDWTRVVVASVPGPGLADASSRAVAFVDELVTARRTRPTADLLSRLVHASVDGATLTRDEIVLTALLLVVASHDSTLSLVGAVVLALLSEPVRWTDRDREAARLADLTDHLLRFDGTENLAEYRFAVGPVDIGCTAIPANDLVIISLLATEGAPARTAVPGVAEAGLHHHLGTGLARSVARTALHHMLSHIGDVRMVLAPGTLTWYDDASRHGPRSLPVLLP